MSRRRPCLTCGGPKPAGKGHKYCRSCIEANRALKNRSYRPRTAQQHREWSLRKRYGITTSDYEAMRDAQGGVCAICQRPPRSGRHLPVDHDHATGEVRGLLCHACNAMVGMIERNGERVASYLRCPPSFLALAEVQP